MVEKSVNVIAVQFSSSVSVLLDHPRPVDKKASNAHFKQYETVCGQRIQSCKDWWTAILTN